MDPAFEGVGQEAKLWIWRIEDFEVKPYAENQYGKFYEGDCYIVLKTTLKGDQLIHDVHFWLGKESSQDEWGTAAIKAVELDDSLGGKPVQHREVQGHESALFLSYFKKAGIQYLKGGVASGFRHVDPDDYEPALFQVKGRRNVRVTQVEMGVGSMNKGDCFILDTVDTVYVWTGPESRRTERLKAIQSATEMRDNDHAGGAKVLILDEFADGGEFEAFFEALGGGSNDDVADAPAADDDVSHERNEQKEVTLYKVSDGGDDSVEIEEVGGRPLTQDMLKSESGSQDCFILDTGASGFFVWIGRESTKAEKESAVNKATKYMEQKGLPVWTKVERIVEDAEPAVFKQYFERWVDDDEQVGLGKVYTQEQIAESLPNLDLSARSPEERRHLVKKSAGSAIGFMPDDASGAVEIYRIEEMELAPVAEEAHGMFFGGDSYVIKYTYEKEGREQYIIYFWQGNESSQDEKAASALQAVKMDDELGGKAVQVRISQGEEPRHFLMLFKGKMIVFMGGHASGFKNVHDHDTYDADGTRMFHVRGTCEADTRAVQVPEQAAYLSPDDVFVLETPGATYIWNGQQACEEEKSVSASIAALVSPDAEPQVINQGEEPEEFWAALDASPDQMGSHQPSSPVRGKKLIHCSINKSGNFIVDELDGFEQDDLNDDDVMLVDTGDEVYCWIGSEASAMEKEKAFQLAKKFVETDPSPRKDATVIQVKEGNEPASFKALFPSWNDSLFEERPKYDDVKSMIAQFNASM
ncbi:gelsolin, cytoplasmic-like isoform X3 [Amphibalanus amphitrite]|uniref:gelsolin, cytoplasmic-like isoform X3 n=1 Tax=Amphibalanus amphitrite TaxID=1232801 RepID=UPI001C91E163|nr:gelsolin, cytoplasmic-like isoform X3 [Amphibalanus amphitrite]